jgi:hypothetical protein
MINRFRKVDHNLFRGSAPSIKDLPKLKKLGIKQIISLDKQAGDKIDRACKLLGIKHIMLPIDINKKSSLKNFLRHDIVKMIINGGPTYIHCAMGKDRTSLAVAMYRCEKDGWSCEKALKEAYSLGFGIGVDPKVVKLYKKLIQKACGCKDEDHNEAYDVVSNQREYPSDYMDYTLGPWEQQSWSPYLDHNVREFPYADAQIDWPKESEQYETRETYNIDNSIPVKRRIRNEIPQIGVYDQNTQGINGAGPSMIGSGFI